MEWVETTAKTVDEAKGLALDRLGVAEEDAEFEIVEEPRPGLFGRMRGEARVRARVRPTRPRPKVERRDRKRGKGDKADKADKAAQDNGDSRAASRSAATGTVTAEEVGDELAAVGEGAAVAATATATRDRSRRSGGRGGGSRRGEKKDMDEERTSSGEAPDAAAVGAAAVAFLEGLVSAFGAEATVQLDATGAEDGEEMEVRVEGEGLGVLVGPRGATLLAIQDLTRVASQRRLGDHQTRLRIDIASYRQKRREALGRFTDKIAAEVVETGEERVLEAMPSADRKIVHDTLSGRTDVTTRSEGEEPNRHVVIAPA